jgi:hypothetical protein
MAYTYLLGWTNLNKFYYGVRFSKNCHPDELCKTYFSSSKHVKKIISENGLPNIIEVRKTFSDVNTARIWEHKVLRRLKVVNEDKWVNKTDNISISLDASVFVHTEEIRKKKSLSHIGKKHSEETKRKISEAQKGKPRNYLKGKKKPEHALLMSKMQKEFGGFALKQKVT